MKSTLQAFCVIFHASHYNFYLYCIQFKPLHFDKTLYDSRQNHVHVTNVTTGLIAKSGLCHPLFLNI